MRVIIITVGTRGDVQPFCMLSQGKMIGSLDDYYYHATIITITRRVLLYHHVLSVVIELQDVHNKNA